MHIFLVPDMSCGGCVQAITRGLQALDPKAGVSADLAAKRVTVETDATAERVGEALRKLGFPATLAE